MVTLNDYKASSIKLEIYVAWKHHQQQECVERVFLVLGHSYNAAWIQRLEELGWNLLLKESADMKCAMYDQHVEYYTEYKFTLVCKS